MKISPHTIVLSITMAAATAAQAEDINAPFDADTPAWGWGWADESPDVTGDGWRILTGSWRVEGGQLRGNFPRVGISNVLVYGRQGAGPDFDATATYDVSFEDASNPPLSMTGARLMQEGIRMKLADRFTSELVWVNRL